MRTTLEISVILCALKCLSSVILYIYMYIYTHIYTYIYIYVYSLFAFASKLSLFVMYIIVSK